MIDMDDFFKCSELRDFDDNFSLIKYVSSKIDESEARKIIIHILDIWDNVNKEAKKIWIDLIGRAGFYPYFMDKVKSQERVHLSVQTQIKTEFFKSDYLPNVYFHEQQKEIEQALSNGENVAVSAPTSFGKSLLIEEIVARRKFNNILIIQPTLALIDETRKKLSHYKDFYNLIINTRQKVKERNIFILTAERVLEFPDLPHIDFFVIDEFYKISNRLNDSRIDALNVALLKIMNYKPQAMFLTPTVDSLSETFREKYQINFFKTDYALVNTNVIEVRNKNNNTLTGNSKKNKLFKMLSEQDNSSIVYVKSPKEAYKLAGEYIEYLKQSDYEIRNNDLEIFDWIDENISPDWQLKNLLKYGIGAHNGALPRHVVTTEIDLFNERKLQVLFATVSLIEGVNTVAKNMFIFSQNKGTNKIDFFDFANIRGRAGRMNQHFTGNVYLFIDKIEGEEFVIDVPSIDQSPVSDEILVNIPDDEAKEIERKHELEKDLDAEIQDIIRNNLISIKGQKSLYKYIEEEKEKLTFLKWDGVPAYDELWQTLYLGYKFLKENENEGFVKNKAVTALKFVNQPLKKTINEQCEYFESEGKRDSLNKAIDHVLKFQRNEASFEIPKILAVVDSIQRYVFNKAYMKAGDYTTFASLLENEQVDERLQFLIDYGVPSSAVKKVKKLPKNLEEDLQIIQYLKNNFKDFNDNLIAYEKKLLWQAIE
ncbi:DEAD/DEAH box helicase [Streptococcus sp. SI1]|uniref:Putative helicase n=1 Tax=Streptococcus intermedius B196 TaxID=862967 RepID=T1ZDV6_STRIT|nr:MULTISPECIES: DEAD/DEAH box helicase [Streptococcus]AGU76055.1 putative helicase [Streptococcus intermedius B196]MDN5016380.1 DEAD/DEAH box helicase [Streptococcus sp. SI1]MDP1433440.1 DEAD/DEAH box helicase [Streptococcus intermedius]